MQPYQVKHKERNSNIELFRICAMLCIIAHHYVVNSGLLDVMSEHPGDPRTLFLYLFGMWGKTGINCFVLITGWYMCSSNISLLKFAKLFFNVEFYNILIGSIFILSGFSQFYWGGLLRMVWPIWFVKDNFISCYLLFFLLIPFINILIRNITQKQHLLLLIITLSIYSGLGSIPLCKVSMNYISWFIVLYLIASYLRLYPTKNSHNCSFWGLMLLFSVLVSMASVILFSNYHFPNRILGFDINITPYFLVSDSNKILAVIVAVCGFMFFQNLKIKPNHLINMIAASTFGVLLIHANSDTMRQWLWKDTLNNIEQFNASLPHLIITATLSVIVVFSICILIDKIRILLFERPFFNWLDTRSQLCQRKTY